jgi:hypothetical protein
MPTNPNDIANLTCFPKKPVTVTVVRCKDHQPILIFSVSQPTTGQFIASNTASNLFVACLVPGDTFRVAANGYQNKDVVVSSSAVTSGFLEVCLDENPPQPPPPGRWPYCFVLTALKLSPESDYANLLRSFRDVLLGFPGGQRVVAYYYDESVRKELLGRLSKPGRALEAFRVLVEATPIILEFARPRSSTFGNTCACNNQVALSRDLAERALALLNSLEKEVGNRRVKEALAFGAHLVQQSTGMRAGQILNVLARTEADTMTDVLAERASTDRAKVKKRR